MTQLPFPSQPPLAQQFPPSAYPTQHPQDSYRRDSVSSVASSGINGTNFAIPAFQQSPPVPQSPAFPSYPSPTSPYPYQAQYYQPTSLLPYQSSLQPSTSSQHPVPPPRRSATLPSAPLPPQQPTVVVPAVETPLAAHHRSLVAYYWHYAQQGYAAPLTAAPGTEEIVMQEKARREAVDWARQCGMEVREVESQAGVERARTASRPLPTAPSTGSTIESSTATPPMVPPASSRPTSIVGINGSRPLPSAPGVPTRSVSLANPTHSTLPNTTPPHRSFSEAQSHPRPLPTTLPSIPATQADSSTSERKRPLPAPPAVPSVSADNEQLADRVGAITISAPALSLSPAPQHDAPPSIPTISFGDESPEVVPPPRSRSPHPTPPAVPTLSFNDEPEETASSPAIPSFSFSTDEDLAPRTVEERRAPPVHPRYDPSHPSHALYHPTSVASPLPHSSSQHVSLPATTEAGTIECTSCRQPIFGRVLMALSRNWHPNCFICAEKGCGEKLEVMEFEGTPEDWEERGEGEESEGESLQGKAWCMVHFEERFALQCYHCHTPISSADYLPINDTSLPPLKNSSPSSSTTRYYHPLHFFCAGCGDPFLDPVAYERSGEAIAMPYYVRERHPYCGKCDLRIWREKCPGCKLGLREEDGYVEIGGEGEGAEKKKWHEGCFKCSMCSKPLTGIYLLRAEPSTSKSAATQAVSPEEKPYCGECFDIVAKAEASAAVV